MQGKFTLKSFLEFIRYSIVGGITTCLNLVVFYLFTHTSMNYVVNNIVSYFIAVIVSYYLNERFVFLNQDQKSKHFIKIVKYILIRAVSILVDSGLLYVCVSIFKCDVMISKLIISMGVIICTYIFNRLFVFKKHTCKSQVPK